MVSGILEHLVAKAETALAPLSVHLEITRRCNLICRHCYQVKSDNRAEMTMPRILGLIDELRQAGCLYLNISGGEPLMRTDFMDICQKAHSSNLVIQISTNGTLITESSARQLTGLNILDISLSIYGARAETHDQITGQEGSFHKTINTARILKDLGLSVRFKFIMMNCNINEYEPMRQLSEQLGIPYDLDPVITPKDNGDMTPTKFRLQDDELTKVYRSQIHNSELITNNYGQVCSFGRSHCAVSAYGDVYPCIQLPVAAGNINTQPFITIWQNSSWLKEVRAFNLGKVTACQDCGDANHCHRCPGLAYVEEGSLYQPSREACRHADIIKSIRNPPFQQGL